MSETARVRDGWTTGACLLLVGGLALLVVVLPLAFSWHVAATFFGAKVFPLYGGAALVVLSACVSGVRGRLNTGMRVDAAEWLALAFLVWGVVAAVAAAARWTALLGTYNQGTGYLFWAACLAVWATLRRAGLTRRQRDVVLSAVVATGVVVGLLALLQVMHWGPLQFRMGFRADGRAGSTLGNPVYAGSYMALVALVGLDRLARATGALARSAWAVGLAVIVGGLLSTLSRAGFLGLVAGAVVWGVLTLTTSREGDRASRSGVATAVTVVLVVALVGQVLVPRLHQTPAATKAAAGIDVEAARGFGARPLIWQTAIRAIVDRPILGWGPNSFRFASFRHATAERLRAEPGVRDGDAHDLFLEISATWGVPGLVLLLAWVGMVAVGLWRRMRAGPSGGVSCLGLGALASFVVSSAATPQHLAVTALVVVLLGLCGPRDDSAGVAALRTDSAEPVVSNRRPAWVQPTAAGICALVFGAAAFGGAQLYRADAHYQRGVIGAGALPDRGVSDLEAATRAMPINEYYWAGLARARADLGFREAQPVLVDAAVVDLGHALRLAPMDADAWTLLAGIELQRAGWQAARSAAERALARAPVEPRPRAYLGVALVHLGEVDEGLDQVDQALAAGLPDARVSYAAGQAYQAAGENTRAIALYRQALTIDPRFGAAQVALDSMGGS